MKNVYNEICNKLKIGKLIQFEQINGGLTNKIIKIITTDGNFAFKIINPDNIITRPELLVKIEFSEQIANKAKNNNINSVCALKFNEKYVQNYQDIYFLVYQWIDGKILLSKEIKTNHIKTIANQLARLHKIEVEHKTDIKKYEKIEYSKYYELLKNNDEKWSQYFLNNYNSLLNIYNKAYSYYLKLSNQISYIHKDLNRKNIIWKNDVPYIIDFETATIGNPSLDFFNSAWFLTEDVNYDKYYEFAKEYFSINTLVDDINIAAYASIIEECNWLEYSLKRALKIQSSNIDEINLGKNSIESSLKEIINYYNKVPLMIEIINKVWEEL